MVVRLDPLLTPGLVALAAGVSVDTVKRWLTEGLKGVGRLKREPGIGTRLVRTSELERYLTAREAHRLKELGDEYESALPPSGRMNPPHVREAAKVRAAELYGGKR